MRRTISAPSLFALALLALAVLPAAPALAHGKPSPRPPGLTTQGHVGVGRHPLGVAVHPDRGWAVVTNRDGGSVSIIDLAARAELGRIPVGRRPTGVAVNPDTNVAAVALEGERALALVDLDGRAVIAKVPVGRGPAGVAIDPALNVAVVANRLARSVSVVDLASATVLLETRVGRGPNGVAVNPLTHAFAITNEIDGTVAILDFSDPGAPRSAAVIALPGSRHHHHHGRSRPAGIAFDYGQALNRLVVADPGLGAVHVVTLTPTNEPAGIKSLDLGRRPAGVAVNPGGGVALVTSDEDDVFEVRLGTPSIGSRVDVGRRPRGVAIDPVTCRAAVANSRSNSASILGLPCGPRLITLAPTQVQAAAPFTLTLEGFGWAPGVTVNFGGASGLVPSTVTPETITIGLTAPAAAGPVAVSVTFGGTISNALTLAVTSGAPPLALASVTPASAPANGDTLSLRLVGQGFLAGARVVFDGQTLPAVAVVGCAVPTCVAANVPGYPGSALTLGGGSVTVQVENPGGARSNARTVTLVNPMPLIAEIEPGFVAAGATDTPIDVVGEGFTARLAAGQLVALSQVLFDGVPVATVPSDEQPTGRLVATIPAPLLTPGPHELSVANPAPGGGTSAPVPFVVQTVTLPPSVTIRAVPTPSTTVSSVALMRRGAQTLGAALLCDAGALQLFDATTPAAPALLGAPVPLADPFCGSTGEVAADPVRGLFVVALTATDQVALVDVTNPSSPTVTTVTLATSAAPFAVAVDALAGRAIVTQLGVLDPAGPDIAVIDLATTVVSTIRIPGGQTLLTVAVNPTTNQAVVVDHGDPRTVLRRVDLATGTVSAPLDVGDSPAVVAVNPATNVAVVAMQDENRIVLVDLATLTITATLAAGEAPSGVAVDPATNRALVSNADNNEITVVNLATRTVAARWILPATGVEGPHAIVWLPDPTLGVASLGSLDSEGFLVLGIPPAALP